VAHSLHRSQQVDDVVGQAGANAVDNMRRMRDERPELEPHAGAKTTLGVSAVIAITTAIIVIGAIIAIWVY
jgi:hypothetical protein